MIGSIISGMAQTHNAISNTILGAINTYNQDVQNKINQENWEQAFDYQKWLNSTMMQREDNSVQRRAADLAAAGINPMLAGLGGASAQLGQIINPLQQPAVQIPEGTGNINLDKTVEAIQKAEQQKIDRYNAETQRKQEELNEESKKLDNEIAKSEVKIKEGHLNQEELRTELANQQYLQSIKQFSEDFKLRKQEADRKYATDLAKIANEEEANRIAMFKAECDNKTSEAQLIIERVDMTRKEKEYELKKLETEMKKEMDKFERSNQKVMRANQWFDSIVRAIKDITNTVFNPWGLFQGNEKKK